MMELHRYSGLFLNGIQKPLHSTGLSIVRIVILLIPLSLLGSHFFGLEGVFWGRIASDLLSGVIGMLWSYRILRSLQN